MNLLEQSAQNVTKYIKNNKWRASYQKRPIFLLFRCSHTFNVGIWNLGQDSFKSLFKWVHQMNTARKVPPLNNIMILMWKPSIKALNHFLGNREFWTKYKSKGIIKKVTYFPLHLWLAKEQQSQNMEESKMLSG